MSLKKSPAQEKLKMSDTVRTLVSYATKYDLYKGHKDWSDLSTEQQDKIIRSELSVSEPYVLTEDMVMEFDLLKNQAQGLRGILVYISMILEKEGYISNASDWDEEQKEEILNFLEETNLGLRLSQAFMDESVMRQKINSTDLEKFSDDDYDFILDMSYEEAKNYIINELLAEEEEESDDAGTENAKFSESYVGSIDDFLRKIATLKINDTTPKEYPLHKKWGWHLT